MQEELTAIMLLACLKKLYWTEPERSSAEEDYRTIVIKTSLPSWKVNTFVKLWADLESENVQFRVSECLMSEGFGSQTVTSHQLIKILSTAILIPIQESGFYPTLSLPVIPLQ